MGMFDDMKRAAQAGPISVDNVIIEPAQRIDTLVLDPDSGRQLRRTDHAGTVWYGGRPTMVGAHRCPGPTRVTVLCAPEVLRRPDA